MCLRHTRDGWKEHSKRIQRATTVRGRGLTRFRARTFLVRKGWMTPQEQRAVVGVVREIEPGFYVPKTRWGQPMRLKMNCLGHHWSARDYKYHSVRSDVDGLPCPPVPGELQELARRALIGTAYLAASDYRPYDVVIVNWYAEDGGRLGNHVDNSETKESLASGYPVVSLSLGASCVFKFGGPNRTDPYEKYVLDSGDLVIFGRSMRLAYHGVQKILPGTTPPDLGLTGGGRINLTFRLL